MSKKFSVQSTRAYLASRVTKIIGVFIATILIGINLYVGIFMATLVTNNRNIQIEEGISLPVIRKSDYDSAKSDILRRQSKQLKFISDTVDPFET